jgi:hypothetical protein
MIKCEKRYKVREINRDIKMILLMGERLWEDLLDMRKERDVLIIKM